MNIQPPTTEMTHVLLQTLKRIESKLDQLQDLQNIAEAVLEIQQILKKRETRWNPLIRSFKQFISLVD